MPVNEGNRAGGMLCPQEVRSEFRTLRIRETEARAEAQRAELRLDQDFASPILLAMAEKAWSRLDEIKLSKRRLMRQYPAEFGYV